jgi:hypothetical protein
MKFLSKNFTYLLVLTVLMIFTSGCVNVDQKTVINNDGSGNIVLHYWTKNSNLSMGDEVGGFAFADTKVRENYSSGNTEVTDVKIEKNDVDSTSHVNVKLNYKDFNKLSEAKAYSKVTPVWTKGDNGMTFSYTIAKDTANAGNMGMNEYTLTYAFEFPGDVLETNGRKDGSNKVVWEKTVADLKDDLVFTATVKSGGKGCGLFGIELPIVILLGSVLAYRRFKK